VKSKSIMRCMLLFLTIALIAFVWSSAALAQPQESCSGSAHFSITASQQVLHTGDIETWNVQISNDCFWDNPSNKVTAKFVANAALCGTSDVKITLAFGAPGTFEFQSCSFVDPVISCALDPSDSSGNTVLIKTNCIGIPLTAGGSASLAIINAKAINVPPGNSATIVGTATLVPFNGPIITTDPICISTEYAGAEGTKSVQYLPQPCIHVTKSVEPLKSKPTDSVTYTIGVCNCGDIDLTGITVSDTKMGNLVPPFPSTLAKGTVGNPNCITKNIPWTIPGGTDVTVPYVNQVTVNSNETAESCFDCTGASCVDCTKTATASVDLFKPDVTISKACKCNPRDLSIGCQAGDNVDYTITVNNLSTADTPALTCTVKDPLLGVNKTLNWATSTGQQDVTNKKRIFQESDPECLDNTASLHCTIAGFPNVINKDASCEVCKNTPTTTGGEEPFKAVVRNDSSIPGFYISPKLYQFTHPNTDYYATCTDILFKGDPRITAECQVFGNGFKCPSACREVFKSKTSAIQPEVCCTSKTVDDFSSDVNNELHCPDVNTALTSKGNSGWYEWLIALPKKPVDEMNIEIECGVLKPNSWPLFGHESIELCAAVTGEKIGPNCTRIPGTPLITSGLPRLEVIAHPGCNNDFTPFHLTAYQNPGQYAITRATDPQCPSGFPCLNDSTSLQVLDGTVRARIALKACMEKTILVKWPKAGEINELGETEAALEAGDLIKVRIKVPAGNTVDLYCSQYSVTIGGIGIPESLLDQRNCSCISDTDCVMDEL
jgi:hypothetical protein